LETHAHTTFLLRVLGAASALSDSSCSPGPSASSSVYSNQSIADRNCHGVFSGVAVARNLKSDYSKNSSAVELGNDSADDVQINQTGRISPRRNVGNAFTADHHICEALPLGLAPMKVARICSVSDIRY
jgi:hypothetical protein